MKTLTNRRQRIRWALIMISFFLFPVTLNYYSPYLFVVGATKGIVSGSAIFFTTLIVSGVFFGRGYCAWVCPGAGLQEACYGTCTRPTPKGWPRIINHMIWIVWMGAIIWLFINAGGMITVEPLYHTGNGISVHNFDSLMRYLAVAGSILIMGLFISRRAFCHTICWMAPFLIIGEKTGRWLGLPQLGLVAKPADCKMCGLCTKNCPMDLPVEELVRKSDMKHVDCINCGRCVDICKRNAIRFSWWDQAHRLENVEVRKGLLS